MIPAQVSGGPSEPRRGGCLTAALVVFGVLSLLASLINLGFSGGLASQLPNAPAWAPTGVLSMGLLGLLSVAGLVLIWRWRRAGLYLYIAVGLAVFALNVSLVGLGMSVIGLTGLVIITILVSRQWGDFS